MVVVRKYQVLIGEPILAEYYRYKNKITSRLGLRRGNLICCRTALPLFLLARSGGADLPYLLYILITAEAVVPQCEDAHDPISSSDKLQCNYRDLLIFLSIQFKNPHLMGIFELVLTRLHLTLIHHWLFFCFTHFAGFAV